MTIIVIRVGLSYLYLCSNVVVVMYTENIDWHAFDTNDHRHKQFVLDIVQILQRSSINASRVLVMAGQIMKGFITHIDIVYNKNVLITEKKLQRKK